MMRRQFIFLFSLFIALTAAAQQQEKAERFLLEGHRQMMLGNHSDAFELIRHSLDIDPQSSAALEQMVSFLQYLRADSLAMDYLNRAIELDPDNYWAQQTLVETLVGQDKTDEAIEVLERLVVLFPKKENVLLMLLDLYQQKHDHENVVKLLDQLETKEGKSEQLSMEKFRAYVMMDDYERAFEEMTELAQEYPNDLKYRVLIGDLYVDEKRFDEARKIYDEVEAIDSENVYLMASLLAFYSQTGEDSLYERQLRKLCTSPNLEEENRMRFLNSLVIQHLQEHRDPSMLTGVFRQVLELPQEDTQIAELCVRYMLTAGCQEEEVKPVLMKMLEIDPECEMARTQLLQYAVESDDNKAVIAVCRPAVNYGIANLVFYYYLGISYLQLDSAQLAIDVFKSGLDHTDNKTELQLVTNLYALMGDTYHKLGDMRHAYESYDSCLAIRPDEVLVLNNYAYYLSLEGKQLDKAEEMSLRSIKKEPDNATYLDTYAWILFKQKRYVEAKEYIDRVLELLGDDVSSDDANIIEHAGDIYAKNKQKARAIELWQRSADLGNDSALLRRKLLKKKYLAY